MGIFTESNDYFYRRIIRELLDAIDLIEDKTFTRDLEPYKAEAVWDEAIEAARQALKD